ncbi:LuxR family transcriptional regulator [Streptomyces sp. NPDC053755]|uniref:helix-turn-helix transcriptional regulator n=1 Tax=Streptomyces sp. NPDC053755 TaxID=3155815 RepID=UPI00341DF7D4
MSGGTSAAAATGLHGRTTELAAVDALSARVGAGSSGVLLVTGSPGTGRTALLRHAARDFPGTARLVLPPPGNRVPWSGVRALLSAFGPGPSAARRALRVARGPEGLGAAVAGLAPERPLLLCVDDHHLWDAHSRAALASALRAGGPAGVGWLVSYARHHRSPDVPGAQVVRLGPLSAQSAGRLLDDVSPGPLAPAVRARLLREAVGHPGVLAATARRLSAAQLAGRAPLPHPLTDGPVLTEVYGGLLDSLPAESRRLLALVAVAGEAAGGPDGARPTVDADAVLAAARATRTSPETLDGLLADGLLGGALPALRFEDPFLRRAVLAGTPASWRSSAGALFTPPSDGPAPGLDDEGHDGAGRDDAGHEGASYDGGAPAEATRTRGHAEGRSAAHAGAPSAQRRAPVAGGRHDGSLGAGPGPSAAASSPAARGGARRAAGPQPFPLLRAVSHRADRLRAPDEVRSLADVVRGRAELLRGLTDLADGPVGDAHQALLLASGLLRDEAPREAADARFLAMEAAWAAGDPAACLTALDGGGDRVASVRRGTAPGDGCHTGGDGAEQDFLDGMRAALAIRLHEARAPLSRVVARDGTSDDPRLLLRAGSAALVLGDTASAARVYGRALARVRAEGRNAMIPRVLEHLAYAELRAGRHGRAGTHAREGLRAAELTGQQNVAAHQHAVLALVASVAGDAASVEEHARQALAVARGHGLAQAATLAEWALARAELGQGLAAQATARLAQLVLPGPRSGHFALRMLAVPCFVEAADATGRGEEARAAAEEFTVWAAQGVDPQAPAQLARCRALLTAPEDSAHWYAEAMRRHDTSGNDFERARTLLAYGKWLRRRRRSLEARVRLSDALVTFERAAAEIWAAQARAELRATGGAAGGPSGTAAPGDLTPQQQRIAALASEGATNREIADRLSISPRTVDHHLRNVFARLGVRSRVELSGVLARAARGAQGR